MSILQRLIDTKYGVKTTIIENPLVSQVEVTKTKIVSSNPDRVGLVIVNNGANVVYLTPSNLTAVGNGIRLVGNGGVATLDWEKDLSLVGSEWYGIADGGASACYVIEVVGVSI